MSSATHSLGGLVRETAGLLQGRGIAAARSEARDLVAAVLDRPRFWPTLHGDVVADAETAAAVRVAAARRAAGAPFAYAVGRASFRFLTLTVDERVLIPRPETEQLVGLVLEQAHPGQTVADIGTGSGAIAIALATERRFSRIVATDVSRDALQVARFNAAENETSLNAPVDFRCGATLAPLGDEMFDVVVSNPPYIAPSEATELPPSVRDWEPAQALICHREGLAVAEELILNASRNINPGGLLALEVDSRRARQAAELATASGNWSNVSIRRDLTGRDRFLLARRACHHSER
ncbi:MAG: peptide chain release factor N(5)-glutamine methyltransferase [Gemmatimonadota bacterium]